MMKFFVITVILIILIIIISVLLAILIKKKLYYKYIIKDKDLSLFDYLMDYDGSWFFKEIDYNVIEKKELEEYYYILKRRMKILHWVAIIAFITLFIFGTLMKFLGFV